MWLSSLLCLALEARWTPAADGGPARFSKRYRDANGIDDSKWGGGDSHESSSSLQIFPSSTEGWMLALVAAALLYALYTQQQQRQFGPGRVRAGGDSSHAPSQASEAARAAFMKKYG